MLNKVFLMGRLTRDPEVRYTQSQTPVASFALAVERDFMSKNSTERQTDFFNCTAWRSTAEFVNKYFRKGSMAVIVGRLETRKYTDKSGAERTAWEVVADTVYFAESKKNSADTAQTAFTPPSGAAPAASFTDVTDSSSDELPF